ncbi:MAG: macro domain-containing protein [Rhodospirillales bacterium]|nr:macro domain-containing protein [Rhodospirillales bacterium]
MIEYRAGNILESGAEAVVNTVNCVGVMGRGIALQFKKAFPANFAAYAEACKRKQVQPGRMFVFETGELTNPRYIVNFPTKRHWRGKSRIEDIETGLASLRAELELRNIRSAAIPALGCGLGGLSWPDVRERIAAALGGLTDTGIIVYEPGEAPAPKKMARNRKVPEMTPGRAALVGLIDRYLTGLLDPFVTLLEVHKLLYFMQEAGQPLRLNYEKGHYGPYAGNLRHVLHAIEGYLISGFGDGGDRPDKQLELLPGATEAARKRIESDADTRSRFDRVADLIGGFESPFGLELLATVHWIVKWEQPRSDDDLVARTYAWNERKKRFSRRQILLAKTLLAQKAWLPATAGGSA